MRLTSSLYCGVLERHHLLAPPAPALCPDEHAWGEEGERKEEGRPRVGGWRCLLLRFYHYLSHEMGLTAKETNAITNSPTVVLWRGAKLLYIALLHVYSRFSLHE